MIAISDIQICNLALRHIGQKPIVSLDEDNSNARTLNGVYTATRDSALTAKDWNFARVKAALAVISGAPAVGWTYSYQYPAKCLAVRKIFIDIENKNPAPIEYEINYIPASGAKVIACDEESAYAWYTYQVTDPGVFSKSFVMALSFLLASQIASTLTANEEKAKLMLQIYNSLLSDTARGANLEQYIKPSTSSSIEDSRG